MSKIEVNARLFEKNLRSLISDMVWKNQDLAIKSESPVYTDIIAADKYTSAARKLLMHYSVSELENVEDYTQDQFNQYINSVDTKYSGLMKTFYNYTERNNYYRMLYGLPNIECVADVSSLRDEIEILKSNLSMDITPSMRTQILNQIAKKELEIKNLEKFIIYPKPHNQWGLPTNVPVHLLDSGTRLMLDHAGEFDDYKELSKNNEKIRYVNYMTTKRIHPFVARLAGRFEMLYTPETAIASLHNDFQQIYAECREFMIQRYYSDAFRNQGDNYEGFVGLAILFMTIQRMHVKYLEADVTRDFYDLDSIKLVYDAYSVPFYEDIPTSYHQKIVKCINRLLAYKGSNQVFFDLCALFDYSSLKIFQYYLLKKRRMDEHGDPIFVYDDSGEPVNESMYDIKFIQGQLGGDPFMEVTDPNNELDYYGVTSADNFWINDEDLLTKLYSMEYNFIETKYLGLQMIFSVTKFSFESGYFIRLIMDNRNRMRNIKVSHGKLGFEIDLFTLVIYIHAILCLMLGYEGNIPSNISSFGKVIGFNFKDGIEYVRKVIDTKSGIIGDKAGQILTIINKIKITDMPSISTSYASIKELEELLQSVMWETHDKDVYYAFKDLYRALLTTSYASEIFTKSNGEFAKSYMDLLSDINMSLAIRIQYMSSADLTSELQYSLVALQKVCDDLKYIQNFGSASGEVVADYLYKLIRLFKSAKAELIDFNIMYIMDGRVTNLLKWLTSLSVGSMSVDLPGDEIEFFDYIKKVIMKITVKSELTMKDYNLMMAMCRFAYDHLIIYDELGLGSFKFSDVESMFELFDYVTTVVTKVNVKGKLLLKESFSQYIEKNSYTSRMTELAGSDMSFRDYIDEQARSIYTSSDLILKDGASRQFGIINLEKTTAIALKDSLINNPLFVTIGVNYVYYCDKYTAGNTIANDISGYSSLRSLNTNQMYADPDGDGVVFDIASANDQSRRVYTVIATSDRNITSGVWYFVGKVSELYEGDDIHPIISMGEASLLVKNNKYSLNGLSEDISGINPFEFSTIAFAYDNDTGIGTLYNNGRKITTVNGVNVKMESMMMIGGMHTSSNTYVMANAKINMKFFAIGVEIPSEKNIIANCKYLMSRYKIS